MINARSMVSRPQPLMASAPQVNTRIMRKRIHVRIEHVQPSRCREEFLNRRASNDLKKEAAKKAGGQFQPSDHSKASSCRLTLSFSISEKAPKTKRNPVGTRDGFVLENVVPETITAIPYDIVKEGLQ